MGRRALSPFEYTLDVFAMTYFAVRAAIFDQARGVREVTRVVSAQIHFTGVQALPLIGVLALASGALVMLQAASQLSLFGGVAATGDLMIAVVVRELAPLLTALIVIARSGTAVASEIGQMRVNREIEALESMGIHPLGYVVFPRLLGGVISVMCLSVFFVAVAMFGGYALTMSLHALPLAYYLDGIARATTTLDISLFLLKNTFGGTIIFVICCYQGLLVRRGPFEVPQVTTRAVVNGVIYVVAFNAAVTTWFYLARLEALARRF